MTPNHLNKSLNSSILLPPKSDGEQLAIPSDVTHIVIIGANGAGKSRFTDYLIERHADKAFRLSALKAIYDKTDEHPYSIDPIFKDATSRFPMAGKFDTELDRLFALLMQEEMINLVNYKVSHASDPKAVLEATRLDKVINAWHDIFPDNDILVESGKFLFRRGDDTRSYSSIRLSDGERAVLYYLGAVLFAPSDAMIFVDSPEVFLHPSIMQVLWNKVEVLRPDCRFFYTTHDLEFASSRTAASVIWVRDYNAASVTWDYDILPPREGISDELYMAIIGARKPVLFIEGDGIHSIDAKLYPLIFKQYTVKSLGSCNKVIEATRAFNDLATFHHMDSYGIVDRDRRDAGEVDYLRRKKIMVPEVAEIENILILEEVIRAVATSLGRPEDKVFAKVKSAVLDMFRGDLKKQALMHTRHRIKRLVEYRIDGRFTNITTFEEHIAALMGELNPHGLYDDFCRSFHHFLVTGDYAAILRVYNQKSMLSGSNVASLCGLHNKDEYIRHIISILHTDTPAAIRIRNAVISCFGLKDSD